MSKIYSKYLELKEKNPKKLYLFESGKFYIFVGEDVDIINEYVVLKKTKFSKETDKCGFPKEVLNDYLRVFKNHNLLIEIVNSEVINEIDNLKEFFINIDLNKITPLEALNYLKQVKEIVLK